MTLTRRRVLCLVAALPLLFPALPCAAALDVPTTERKALDLADLAAGSGLTPPLDTAATPFPDTEYLRAYRALHAVGLVDPLGEKLDREARAQADGALHLETLVPRVTLRGYALRGNDERTLPHAGGDTLGGGFTSLTAASGAASWGTHVAAAYELQLTQNGTDVDYLTKRLYAKGTLGKWSLKLGRDTVRLGPGYHGSLLLDDNAQPFDLWEVRTDEPVYLPWFLEKLGGFRITVFNGFLSDSNPSAPDSRYGSGVGATKDPRLFGMRVSYHPASWLDLGVSRTAMYSGQGRETYDTVKDWWELLTATHENVQSGDEDRYNNDQYAAYDLTLWLPFVNGLGPLRAGKLYGERAGTDFRANWKNDKGTGGWFPIKLKSIGFLVGGYLSTAVTDFRAEYAETDPDWYHHGEYPQGYSYRGRPLGHAMGGDAKSVFFQVARYLAPDWRVQAALNVEKRGVSLPSTEKRTELGAGLETSQWPLFGFPLTAKLDVLWSHVNDALDEADRGNRNEFYLGVSAAADF